MLAGYLKRHAKWQTGYTRKLFHFLFPKAWMPGRTVPTALRHGGI
jgi:hypothetical protein